MRHDYCELIRVFLLDFIDRGFKIVRHFCGLLVSGHIVDFPEGVEHDKVNQIWESHPFYSCVVAIFYC